LDTELYGETNEKDSWGPRSSLADLSISGQLREVAKPEEFRLVLNLTEYRVNQDFERSVASASRCALPCAIRNRL